MLPATIAVRVLAIGFSAATFRYPLAIPSNSPAPEAIGRAARNLARKSVILRWVWQSSWYSVSVENGYSELGMANVSCGINRSNYRRRGLFSRSWRSVDGRTDPNRYRDCNGSARDWGARIAANTRSFRASALDWATTHMAWMTPGNTMQQRNKRFRSACPGLPTSRTANGGQTIARKYICRLPLKPAGFGQGRALKSKSTPVGFWLGRVKGSFDPRVGFLSHSSHAF
jgi:hypothetical protein